MTGHETFDELVAPYALDALTPEDRRLFEAHLATCENCQHEVAELRRVSMGIGLSTEPEAPPAALRARTLALATAQPQDSAPVLSAARPAPAPASAPVPKPLPFAPPVRRGWSAPAWLALAASLVAIIGLSAYAWGMRSQVMITRELLSDMSARVETLRLQLATARQDSARLASTLSVLHATNVVRVDLRSQPATTEAIGRAFVSPGTGLVFNVSHLPGLAPNRTYQLWVIPPGAEPVSAGTFDVDAAGTSAFTVTLPPSLGTIAMVAVTDEPTGGSPQPTTTPLLVGAVTNN